MIKTAFLSLACVLTQMAAAAPPAFDRVAWQSDFAALKHGLEISYAHLVWFGSPESGVDVPALDRRATAMLAAADSDADARSAILDFVAGFHDGHFSQIPSLEDGAGAGEPADRPADTTAAAACAAYGYAPATRIGFSLPFESLPGFQLQADGIAQPFRAGLIAWQGRTIGLVRIPRFRPAEYPALCLETWQALHDAGQPATADDISDAIGARWLAALAQRLKDLRAAKAAAILVDVGGNGGGNDLGDWAVRLFTPKDVTSAQLFVTAGSASIAYFDEQLDELKGAAKTPDLPDATKAALADAVAAFESRKAEAGKAPCAMDWAWTERRAWGSSACTRLIRSGFASGELGFAAPGSLDPRAAAALYWAVIADPYRGAWDGPVFVLTDPRTGSSAEMFAAHMRDTGIARIVGDRTAGDGCGFMVDPPPIVLPHSRLAFRLPNCVRTRADGSDEVAGVTPDFPILPRADESPRARAARALDAIAQK